MAKSIDFNPFLLYSQQLNAQLHSARQSDNPALFLYQNGARNIIFMLEGLTRIHKNAFHDEKMEKWYERFKKLEDLLGQIDYLDAFCKKFEKDNTLDDNAIVKLRKQMETPLEEMNSILVEKEWLSDKMLKFDAFIEELDFQYNNDYVEIITATFKKEIGKINDFAAGIHFEFHQLEAELHEMRRRLRWLSIYAQAFNGLFQLKRQATDPAWSKKYMTEAIVNSPFNTLPKAVEGLPVIHLDYHAFIALSYVIQNFGTLKDEGLQNEVLVHNLHYADSHAQKMLGGKYADDKTILKTASDLLKIFYEDQVLEKLVKD